MVGGGTGTRAEERRGEEGEEEEETGRTREQVYVWRRMRMHRSRWATPGAPLCRTPPLSTPTNHDQRRTLRRGAVPTCRLCVSLCVMLACSWSLCVSVGCCCVPCMCVCVLVSVAFSLLSGGVFLGRLGLVHRHTRRGGTKRNTQGDKKNQYIQDGACWEGGTIFIHCGGSKEARKKEK